MHISVPIPDDLVARFGNEADLGRRLLEAFGLAEYRAGRMTFTEVQRLLGFSNGPELDTFLEAHGIIEGVTPIEFENEHDRFAAARDLVERFRAFSANKTLGGLDVLELIREGRR